MAKPYKYKALKINGKRIDEHRYVMQQHLGRTLLKNEVVRHKDGNTLNNVIDNLYVITRQQQFEEQLAAGQLSKEILEGLAKKAAGIKKKRVKCKKVNTQSKKVKPKITSAIISRSKQIIVKSENANTVSIKEQIVKVPLRINSKTTIYINKNTSQSEIDRLIKKYNS